MAARTAAAEAPEPNAGWLVNARRNQLELHQKLRDLCQVSFIDFVRAVAPWFIVEEIHLLIAEKLEAVAEGKIDRLMIFMPPRAGKSTLVSVFFPAWYMGRHPDRKVIQVSYKAELAEGFGRQVRELMQDPDYLDIFPHIQVKSDNKAASRFALVPIGEKQAGEYFAVGITGGVAGKGAHLGVVDDPLSEQDADSQVMKDRAWNWWDQGFYTRLQPEFNAIVVMSTRRSLDDVPGRLIEQQKLAQADGDEYADKWTILSIPAVINEKQAKRLNALRQDDRLAPYKRDGKVVTDGYAFDPNRLKDKEGKKLGDTFAPRRWPLERLLRRKANMRDKVWSALYMQNPVVEDGNILKRTWWRPWMGTGPDQKMIYLKNPKLIKPPRCDLIIQVYDTAFEEDEEDDFSARTTWGIFEHSDTGDPVDNRYCCILLEAMNERLSFPDLRDEAIASYNEHEPDVVLVEKKASGHSLIQELRKSKIPVREYNPRDRSKLARAHAASEVLYLGAVWYMPRRFADKVIKQCAEFPNGQFNDLVDTCVMTWLYLRNRCWLQLSDEPERDRKAREEQRRLNAMFNNVIQFPGQRRSYG